MFLPSDVIRQNGSAYQGGTVPSSKFPNVPQGISGLAAWYRADMGITIGTGVSAWADQSGSGDSNKNAVQATGSKQPTLNAVDVAYNNQPTLSFLASALQNLRTGTWVTQPTLQTVIWVGNFDGAASLEYVLDGLTVNTLAIENNAVSNNIVARAATAISAAATNANPAVVVAIFNGASSKLYVSANTPTTGSITAVTLAGLSIGMAGNVGAYQNGKTAEIIVYNRALSSSEVFSLNAYCHTRYGIAIGA